MSRLVVGIQPVREAIRALGSRVEIIQTPSHPSPSPALQALLRYAADQGIPVETVPPPQLDKTAGDARHQGVIAYVPEFTLLSLEELVRTNPTLVVALDRIVDPQNFGAIVRSSVAFGANAILWPEHSSAPLSPAMARASAGAVEHAQLCRVPSLPTALHQLKQSGLQLVGLAGDCSTPLSDLDLLLPTVLVIGSEGTGLRRSVRSACSRVVKIPTVPPIATLNASVSAAIALYEVRRQREHAQA